MINQLNLFIELVRLKKPIGFMLLFWPCAWGLTTAYNFNENLEKYFWFLSLFLIGAILMRSAGCIINDIVDSDFDKKVERTKNWPVASGKISKIKAFIYAMVLCGFAFLVLIQFNNFTILMALLSMPLAFTYPLMKRFTYWPQLFLGIIFNWGVIICSVEFYGTITKEYLILYLACVLWTIGYDTIYAYQDLTDDKKNNIKSTAVLFEDKGKYLVITSYALMLIMIGYLTLNQTFEILKLLVYLCIFIYIIANILKWDHKSEQNSGKKFRQNNVFGAIIFLYLLSF